jgi:hypothetical protein
MRLFAPIITGSLNLTGSLAVTGSVGITSTANDIFIIKKSNGQPILTVSQSGVIVIATQSAELTNLAPYGGIYFTSSSFFVGLD